MNRRPGPKAHSLAASTVLFALCCLTGCGGPEGTGTPAPEAAPPPSAPVTATVPATGVPASPLAGTEWHLVEFQSMDDATGTVRPSDPSLYTMRLGQDGTVSMHLNCNNATGNWSAEPAADPSSGRFALGPLAATRASCPTPSMDESIVAQAGYIATYLLKDGKLYLSLMADGGIYAWEPRNEMR